MYIKKVQVVYILYTDESILAGPDPQELDDILAKIQEVK